jgi:hypothetical protein
MKRNISKTFRRSVGENKMPKPNKSVELPKITQYKIQHAFLLSELERAVIGLVGQGWIPSGGIVYVPFQSRQDGPLQGFYQPLVKEG